MHVRLYREAKRLLIKYEKANQGRWRTEERLASVGNKLRVLTVELR